jgi:thiol-disulfide isomerase/thioredoxin
VRPVVWFFGILLAAGAVVTVWLGFAMVPAARTAALPAAEGGGALPLAGQMAALMLVGRPAPEVTFAAGDGGARSLADFRGRVVLLNLWATWCAPCVAEMGTLDRLQQRLGGEGFEVVALSIDRRGMDDVAPFFAENAIVSLAPYLDPMGKVPGAFGVMAMPTTVIIDRQGNWVGTYIGPAEWDAPEVEALIAHLKAG